MKPRNYVILALLKSGKKGGAHGRSKKAQRRADKIKLKKEFN